MTTAIDARVLIVEDDEALCSLLAEEMREASFHTSTAHSAEEGRRQAAKDDPDVIVSDLRLPFADGMDLLAATRDQPTPPAFIVVTAFGSIEQAVEALKAGADDFLTKPLNLDHLVLAVKRAVEGRQLRMEVERFRRMVGDQDFYGMIGRSPCMRALFEHLVPIAHAEGPVLITGESGVGKELVARALHDESSRAAESFVAVNCAGVPSELLESEFFGHEKGAFTGAVRARKGLFEEADGGTILLDEIAEMPIPLQAKLLRVLQEGRIRPVGSSVERSVDVRVLAATNRDLSARKADGTFREDLYYRLSTFQVRVPPLRERGEDLDLLAARFVEEFSARGGKRIGGFDAEAIQCLRRYEYPGNVRELRNAIERSVAFCSTEDIELSDLPERIRTTAGPARRADDVIDSAVNAEAALPTLADVENGYIRRVLASTSGNKREAARILGISRRTLYRRLETGDT
jgi:DNA-binding NtrC family response regulator